MACAKATPARPTSSDLRAEGGPSSELDDDGMPVPQLSDPTGNAATANDVLRSALSWSSSWSTRALDDLGRAVKTLKRPTPPTVRRRPRL